jgi:hypothetical protein
MDPILQIRLMRSLSHLEIGDWDLFGAWDLVIGN